jgi:hypothetical protein
LNPDRGLGNFKGLGIRVGGDELYALKVGCDHVVDGISARTPDTDYFDLCRFFVVNIGKHFLPSYLFS